MTSTTLCIKEMTRDKENIAELPQEKKISERVSEVISDIDFRNLSDDEVRDLFTTLNNAFLDVLEETNRRGFQIS